MTLGIEQRNLQPDHLAAAGTGGHPRQLLVRVDTLHRSQHASRRALNTGAPMTSNIARKVVQSFQKRPAQRAAGEAAGGLMAPDNAGTAVSEAEARASAPPMADVFCDGACIGNPGPGGYGAIVKLPGFTLS